MDERNNPQISFLLWSNKHQKWWGPNQRGYTSNIAEAGRYTEDEAIRAVVKSAFNGRVDQVTCMVVDPVPDTDVPVAPARRQEDEYSWMT